MMKYTIIKERERIIIFCEQKRERDKIKGKKERLKSELKVLEGEKRICVYVLIVNIECVDSVCHVHRSKIED